MRIFKRLAKVGITPDSFPSLFEEVLKIYVESIEDEREGCAQLCERKGSPELAKLIRERK